MDRVKLNTTQHVYQCEDAGAAEESDFTR